MKKTIALLLTVVLALIIVLSVVVYQVSHHPIKKAEAATIAVAQEVANLKSGENFYWYNGDQTYYTIMGTNETNEKIVVVVSQENQEATVLKKEDIVTEEQARALAREAKNPDRLLETRFGMENGVYIWEVAYKQSNGRLGYYMLNAENGEWIKDIENI